MDRLYTMRTFVTVVDAGSLAAAADALGLSGAAVSRSVANLEAHLGTRLLNRSTRKLSLTESGAAYYERCTQILAAVEEAEAVAGVLATHAVGTLRINATIAFSLRYVIPYLREYAQQFPDIQLDLTLSERTVDLVEEGYDLAIRVAHALDDTVIARKLANARLVACASPEYLDQHGTPALPIDLAQHACLRYANFQQRDEWTFASSDGIQVVRVTGGLIVNNEDALRIATLGSMGIALLPSYLIADDLRDGQLRAVLPGYAPHELGIYAVLPSGRHLSVKVRTFVEFLAGRLRGETARQHAQRDTSAHERGVSALFNAHP